MRPLWPGPVGETARWPCRQSSPMQAPSHQHPCRTSPWRPTHRLERQQLQPSTVSSSSSTNSQEGAPSTTHHHPAPPPAPPASMQELQRTMRQRRVPLGRDAVYAAVVRVVRLLVRHRREEHLHVLRFIRAGAPKGRMYPGSQFPAPWPLIPAPSSAQSSASLHGTVPDTSQPAGGPGDGGASGDAGAHTTAEERWQVHDARVMRQARDVIHACLADARPWLSTAEPREAAHLVFVMGLARVAAPEEHLPQLLAAVQPRLAQCPGDLLSKLAWGAGACGYQPPQSWMLVSRF